MVALTTAVTAIFGWLGTAVTTITAEPVLLVGVGIGIVGSVVGIFKSAV